VEETIERMKEAIAFHIEGLKKEGLRISEATTTAVSIEVVV